MFKVNNVISIVTVFWIVIKGTSASFGDHHYMRNAKYDTDQRSSLEVTDPEQMLPYAHFNWNLCTNAFPNSSFTPMNHLVPNNTVFLVNYPTYKIDNSSATCRDSAITRTGTINTGRQTIVLSIVRWALYDYEDDWKTGICANSTTDILSLRLNDAEAANRELINASFVDTLYYNIDGKAAEPVYLYSTTEYHLLACDDENRTTEVYDKLTDYEGDTCDEEPFAVIEGLDVYPILGWYGIDTREWADNETHVYEFGSLSECYTAKYVLTAKETSEGNRMHYGITLFWLLWMGISILLLHFLV